MPTGAGSLGSIAQSVVKIGSGSILSIAQTVDLKKTGGGQLAAISQDVGNVASGNLCSIAQIVRDSAVPLRFNQPAGVGGVSGFDIQVSIGGQVISPSILRGMLTITRNEGDAALCSFGLQPEYGVQDLNQWHGKEVLIDVVEPGGVTRLYTGKVDIPEIDIELGHITLRCTDSRAERNNALDPDVVKGYGYWSKDLFRDPEDQNEEVKQRFETMTASLDYDAYGVGHVTDWEPKLTADYTLNDASIYRRKPTVTVLARGRVVNQVNLSIEFQYQRLRHRERNYSFDSGLSSDRYGVWGLPPTAIQMISTAEATGWPIYNFISTGLDIGTTQQRGSIKYTPIVDEDGEAVTDQNGNPTFTVTRPEANSDLTGAYAQTASWKASKRWAQNIVEKIAVTVTAPQSIAQYGLVERDISTGTRSEYLTEKWEDYDYYKSIPTSAVKSPNGDWVIDKTSDDIADYNAMVIASLAKARTQIIASHRDNRVTIETPLFPQLDLRHTLETTAGKIQCKGKVSKIIHTLDLSDPDASTEIEISLSQSTGSASDSGLTIPTRPVVTDPDTTSGGVWSNSTAINLGSHVIPVGGTQDPNWNGYISKELAGPSVSNDTGLRVPVSMIIDPPTVDKESRDTKEAESVATNTVEIRNDTLGIVFNDQ